MDTTKQETIPLVELVYRHKIKTDQLPKIQKSSDAYKILRQHWNNDTINLKEEFKIMVIDRNADLLGVSTIASGGINGVVVDLRLVFATAILAKASGIILAHNHPSGNLKPSKSDIDLTQKIKDASAFLDIEILDHIIVTDTNYCSLSDEFLMGG
ncbi:JAB domain-containing protein [Tenacibaculum agarivorans]|uniref:JAB domain-containing protein n=1 Tax=Tenacibaculum agarivorans TaxID=1908389 RepID=UPI00094B8961|nr:JAB domain-containing protein [Tenacibaculum agarivorans]